MSGPDLELLQDVLDAIASDGDRMSAAAFDGYVAALLVCPETILPSEWLPGIWGEYRVFEDDAGAGAAVAVAMGHYNRVARDLAERPEEYAPILGLDCDSGDVLWEPWIGGFERAMRLRPDAWEGIAESGDEEAAASIAMIVGLFNFYCGRTGLTEEAAEELDRVAPAMIPAFVRNLNAWTRSRRFGEPARGFQDFGAGFDLDDPPVFGSRVGDNEPCPCGSGRTYRRCCGAN